MKNIAIIVLAGTAVWLTAGGCEKQEDEVEFLATDPVVQWQNLELPEATAPEDAYVLLVEEATTGLFPAAVAVARVRARYVDDADSATGLELQDEPEVELLPWNSLLDDQRVVSGAFPIMPIVLEGADVTVGHLLTAADEMEATVCLVYATAELSENESEVRGALYDTRNRCPLAVLHARARIDDLGEALDELPAPAPFVPDYFHAAKDPRYHDPPGMAIYKFETAVRDCIIALRKNDISLENLPTDGWVPQQPPHATPWPPPTQSP